ncbi:hypothetical protein QBC47DRAFT_308576 [Echria macrotheca]|uniref:Uncharacterized protein n=1 Tax=Echria macrotheca TaxID=438768 RepID=A0AAJ0B3R4_9PEZI|nr:hypothetical protein QBC47DRAFT_308576 [Echria macrotheca]
MLLSFFSKRVLRGGPKIIFYLAACLSISILGRLALYEISPVPFGITRVIWPLTGYGTDTDPGSAEYETDLEQGLDPGGNLRIVAFGGQDVATPSWTGEGGDSWTDILCRDLNCSPYMSFVPRGHETLTLESHKFYAEALDQIANLTANRTGPGEDYTFQSDLFPLNRRVPDLAQQVTSFLASEESQSSPKETLFIFALGTWDIWTLASLPLDISRPVIDNMTQDIFDQAERLYRHSLETNKAGIFRILVPRVLDPSITPAWQTSRPHLAAVHSPAEQMRNSFLLTGQWNRNLYNNMATWISGGQPEAGSSVSFPPAEEPIPDGEFLAYFFERLTAEAEKAAKGIPRPRGTKIRARENTAGEAHEMVEEETGLSREGFLFDMPEYILTLMADLQLRDAGLRDANGLGAMAFGEGYINMAAPCVDKENVSPGVGCRDRLFSTPFTVGSRAVGDIGRLAADLIREGRSMRVQKLGS